MRKAQGADRKRMFLIYTSNTAGNLISFQVEVVQYDSPLQCYSDDALKEMANRGTWKMTPEQLALMPAEPQKFTPQNSAVLAVLSQDGKGRQC